MSPPAELRPSQVSAIDRLAFRLLPSEEVLWAGRRVPWAPRERIWSAAPAFLGSLALIFAAFGGLLWVAELPGPRQSLAFAAIVALFAVAVAVAPRYLHDPCAYVVTDRRVLWKRGRFVRSMETAGISYARIRWHRAAPGVGHLELVRAVPFGPLARKQRLVLHDVRGPDLVLARIRGVAPSESLGANDVPLVDRLDEGEVVLWGGHPEGWLLGLRELGTAALGVGLVALGVRYALNAIAIVGELGDLGLPLRTWTWVFFFLAISVTWGVITTIGAGLLWHGVFRARALGRETEYVLTDRRLLIRRGATELYVDRQRIVDVAQTPAAGGLSHLYLVLDSPGSRALATSGALRRLPPARDSVLPVLYELRDPERIRSLLGSPVPDDPEPPALEAA